MRLYTIGFTRKPAAEFFARLQQAEVKSLVDVRLNPASQLSGFAKRDDLAFFLKQLCAVSYVPALPLAPTPELLASYRATKNWPDYERQFRALMKSRQVEKLFPPRQFDGACLLCSEDQPHHCHRRLVAEYLRSCWPEVEITHL